MGSYLNRKEEGNVTEEAFKTFFPANEKYDPQNGATASLLTEAIDRAMIDLTKREKDIIKLRFGLNGMRVHTLEEVGLIYGLTRERIRQIENKALKKMRHPRKSRHLRDFLE